MTTSPASPPGPNADRHVTQREFLRLFVAIMLPMVMASLDQGLLATATPIVAAELGELHDSSWIITAYMLMNALTVQIYGRLGDRHGRREMLFVAMGFYVAGAVVSGTAQSMTHLIIGRAIQGIGGGGLMSLSQALIGDVVAPRDRGRAQGNNAAISVLASTLGPLVGGFMVEAAGWRSMFLFTVPLALIAMVVLGRQPVPSTRATTQRTFDLGGFLSLLVLVLGSTAAIELAADPATRLWAAFGAAAALAGLAGLIRTQPRAKNPFFPPSLFAVPAISRASIMTFFHGAALVSLVTTIPLFHAILRSDGVITTAMSMLALTVAFGIAGMIIGNLITMTGRTVLFPTLSLPVTFVAIIFLSIVGPDLSRAALMATYLVIGLSLGTVMSVMNTIIQVTAPDAVRGRAAGSVTFFRSIGAVVGTALVSFVLFAVAPHAAGTDPGAILAGGGSVDPALLDGWRTAFRAAFLTVAAFVVVEWTMGLINPLRRVD